jgi:hypothetical protein
MVVEYPAELRMDRHSASNALECVSIRHREPGFERKPFVAA